MTKNSSSSVTKRLIDILVSITALLATWPLFLFLALVIKISSPGPVFFKQKRQGLNGRVFMIYKFRSMKVHCEKNGSLTQAKKNDERITRVGRIMRKTSLDELPQFINVLAGSMSVVGPRPHAIEHDKIYSERIGFYNERYLVKPGITGLAQINGLRGETRTTKEMEERVRMDLWYAQNWSIWLDIKLIILTPIKLMSKNAY